MAPIKQLTLAQPAKWNLSLSMHSIGWKSIFKRIKRKISLHSLACWGGGGCYTYPFNEKSLTILAWLLYTHFDAIHMHYTTKTAPHFVRLHTLNGSDSVFSLFRTKMFYSVAMLPLRPVSLANLVYASRSCAFFTNYLQPIHVVWTDTIAHRLQATDTNKLMKALSASNEKSYTRSAHTFVALCSSAVGADAVAAAIDTRCCCCCCSNGGRNVSKRQRHKQTNRTYTIVCTAIDSTANERTRNSNNATTTTTTTPPLAANKQQ